MYNITYQPKPYKKINFVLSNVQCQNVQTKLGLATQPKNDLRHNSIKHF